MQMFTYPPIRREIRLIRCAYSFPDTDASRLWWMVAVSSSQAHGGRFPVHNFQELRKFSECQWIFKWKTNYIRGLCCQRVRESKWLLLTLSGSSFMELVTSSKHCDHRSTFAGQQTSEWSAETRKSLTSIMTFGFSVWRFSLIAALEADLIRKGWALKARTMQTGSWGLFRHSD